MIEQPNYTQIPNVYLDEIMQTLSGNENLVFLAIMRKTFGWHKEKDSVSYSQIRKATGIKSNTTIQNALIQLEFYGYIKTEKKGQGIVYEVNIETFTENVKDEKSDLYRNDKATFTENVKDKADAFTETVNTKESNTLKITKEIYIEIDNAYVEEYEKRKGCVPIIIYPSLRKRQKTLLESGISKENIIAAIKEAGDDDWIQKNGFNIMMVLSDKVLQGLINKVLSKSAIPKKQVKHGIGNICPRCGGEIIGGICINCHNLVDENGKELS